MAGEQGTQNRVARSSALVLLLTGVALAGCVALAVGVTVRLVDLPRPRVSADLSAVAAEAAPSATSAKDSAGAGASLAIVGDAASSATDLANEQAARLAARRERAREATERASRSRAVPSAAATSPTATSDGTGDDATPPERPGDPGYYPHRRHWHYDPQYPGVIDPR